jgi:Transposase protein
VSFLILILFLFFNSYLLILAIPTVALPSATFNFDLSSNQLSNLGRQPPNVNSVAHSAAVAPPSTAEYSLFLQSMLDLGRPPSTVSARHNASQLIADCDLPDAHVIDLGRPPSTVSAYHNTALGSQSTTDCDLPDAQLINLGQPPLTVSARRNAASASTSTADCDISTAYFDDLGQPPSSVSVHTAAVAHLSITEGDTSFRSINELAQKPQVFNNNHEMCALRTEIANNMVEQQQMSETLKNNAEAADQKLKALKKQHDAEIRKLKADMQICKSQLENFRVKNDTLRKTQKLNNENMKQCKRDVNKLRKQMKKQTQRNKNILPELKHLLSPTLTSNQIDLILKKKKRVRWTKAELSTAFTVRYFGINAYDFLRKSLNYPLASLSTLRRYAAKLNLKEGHLTDVVNMMKLAGTKLPERDRLTVLSFDEMRVKSIYELDSADDEIVGPHRYLQVNLSSTAPF